MGKLSPLMQMMQRAADKAARGLIRDFSEVEQLQVSRKGPKDFVSSADLRAEEVLIEELTKARPDFGFLNEEGGSIPGADPTHRWIIDPLDGTGNFLHSIPHFCISIALEHTEDGKSEIVAGLIMQPITQDLFIAEKGNGALHNGRRLRVSSRQTIKDSILSTGSVARFGSSDQATNLLRVFARESYGIRCMGAAALDLAYVAAGKYDGFWQRGLKPWDLAAGILMVEEAGGVIRNFALQPDVMTSGDVLASNSQLAPRLDKLLVEALKG